jgi:lipoate-protein ligase A
MASIRFALDDPADGPENMARDLALLALAEQGTLSCRVYSWSEPWVTVGKNQDPLRDLVPDSGTPWVRRPTGGKAVLHGHDLTVGLAVPLASLGLPARTRALGKVYRAVVGPIVSALEMCGLRAALAEDCGPLPTFAATGDCFAIQAPLDIVDRWTGDKLCGCALLVTETAVLAQASIPVTEPLTPPDLVIVGGKVSPLLEWSDGYFPEAMSEAWLAKFQNA